MCHTVAMPPTTPSTPAVPAPRARSDWDAWGTEPAHLPAAAKALIATLLPGKAHPMPRIHTPELTPTKLDEASLTLLAGIVGADHVTVDDPVRVLHLGGKSTPDLLDRRRAGPQRAPDA